MWRVHAVEYHSATKRNEILTRATTWVNLENMLSEKRQTQKATQRIIPFRGNVQKRQIQRWKD